MSRKQDRKKRASKKIANKKGTVYDASRRAASQRKFLTAQQIGVFQPRRPPISPVSLGPPSTAGAIPTPNSPKPGSNLVTSPWRTSRSKPTSAPSKATTASSCSSSSPRCPLPITSVNSPSRLTSLKTSALPTSPRGYANVRKSRPSKPRHQASRLHAGLLRLAPPVLR